MSDGPDAEALVLAPVGGGDLPRSSGWCAPTTSRRARFSTSAGSRTRWLGWPGAMRSAAAGSCASTGGPVGYVVLTWSFSIESGGLDGYIDELFLLPEVRGRGLGRRVLALAEQEARRLGLLRLYLEVEHGNPRDRPLSPRRLRRTPALSDVEAARARNDVTHRPSLLNPETAGGEVMDRLSERIILTPGPVATSAETRQAMLRDFSPERAGPAGADRRVPADPGRARQRRARLCLRADPGHRQRRQRGDARHAGAARPAAPDRQQRLLRRAPEADRRRDRAALCRARPANHRAGRRRCDSTQRSRPIRRSATSWSATSTPAPGCSTRSSRSPRFAGRRGVGLIIDAIASFGGLPLDAAALAPEAIVLSPNKWLEGVPGIGAGGGQSAPRSKRPPAAAIPSASICTGSGRASRRRPLALHPAGPGARGHSSRRCASIAAEGQAARLERVRRNWRCLVDGLRALGVRDGAARRGRGTGDRDLPPAGRPPLRPRALLRGDAGGAASSCSAAR